MDWQCAVAYLHHCMEEAEAKEEFPELPRPLASPKECSIINRV
jgi:hypothetical protein